MPTIKQEAKALVKDLSGKYALFALPIILTIVNFSIVFKEFFQLFTDTGVEDGDFGVGLFPRIVFYSLDFFSISAFFAILKVIRKERQTVTFHDLTLVFSGKRFVKLLLTSWIQSLLLIPVSIMMSIGIVLVIPFLLVWVVDTELRYGFPLLIMALVGLLILIPSLILFLRQSFHYSQTVFVIYDQVRENRYQGALAAIRESKRLMKGHVLELLKLKLSLIGWHLLTFFTCGLAAIYTLPYITAIESIFYHRLREKDLEPTTNQETKTLVS